MFSSVLGVPVLGHIIKGIGTAVCFVASQPVEVTEKVKEGVKIGLNILGIPC